MAYHDWSYIRGVTEDRLRARFSTEFGGNDTAFPNNLYIVGADGYVYFGEHTRVSGAEVEMGRIVAEEDGAILTMRWQDGDSWQITAMSGSETVDHVSRPERSDGRYSKKTAADTIAHLSAQWNADETRIAPFFRRHSRRSEGGFSDEVYELALAISLKRPWEIEPSGCSTVEG